MTGHRTHSLTRTQFSLASDPDARRFRVPPSLARPKQVFLTCHYCSFDPPTVPVGGACPKCGGRSWERFALPYPLVPEHMRT
jgi:hypothetical protein